MDNKNRWLVDLYYKDEIWANELGKFPSMIVYSYVQLKKLVAEGQVYGVMLQLKDLFELLHKIPIIITLVVMGSDDKYKEGNAYAEIFKTSLEAPMSMGQWDTLAAVIVKKNKELQLPKDLIEILKRTHKLYGMEVTNEVPDVINWRNDAIGHGALKFEDDESYKNEVKSLLTLLKEYFDGDCKYSIKGLYDKIFFEIVDQKLIGDNTSVNSEESLFIWVDSIRYNADNFINNHDLRCFFFDSYYSRKNLIKYSSYIGGQNEYLKNKFFSNLYEKYVLKGNKDFTIQSEFISREEDIILEYLNMPKAYIRPMELVDNLIDTMNEIEKGIITIFMERGMGKSAFSNQMSGLYHKVPLVKNSLSRCYHVQNAALRGINDFINSVNFSFRHSFDPTQDLWGSNDDMPLLSADTDCPSADMAKFLNYYHKKYKKEFTILLIDGIDELTGQTKRILDFVPSQVDLEEGVFVILLSRFKDENTVIGDSIRYIVNAEKLSQTQISFYRKDEGNVRVLKECINKQIKDGILPEKIDQDMLLEKADYRFLYLKAYIELRDGASLDNRNEYEFIRSYFEHILSFYGPSQKHKLLEIAITIALFPNISIKKYQEYLYFNDITFEFVGLLNDLLPVITVYHIDGEDVYSFADVAYNEYIISEHSEIAIEVIKKFYTSMTNILESYLKNYGLIRLIELLSDKIEEKLNQSIGFFTEGVLNIWSNTYTQISIKDCFFDNFISVELLLSLENDNWTRIGYGLYIKNEMKECIGAALDYCISHPDDKGAQNWRKEILKRISSNKRGYNPFHNFFMYIHESKYYSKIYNYLLDNNSKLKIKEWFGIIEYNFSDTTIELLQKRDLIIEFLDYLANDHYGFNMSRWVKKLYEASLSSKDEERVLNYKLWQHVYKKESEKEKNYILCARECYKAIQEKGYRIDNSLFKDNIEDILDKIERKDVDTSKYIKLKEAAIKKLLNFNTPWENNPDETGPTYEIYSRIKYKEFGSYIHDNDIAELHSAYYKRLCYELGNGSLGLFIESEILIDDFFIEILKNEYGDTEEYYLNLQKWIDEIIKIPQSSEVIKLLSSMMIERVNWLFIHDRERIAVEYLEDYVFNYDTKAFFESGIDNSIIGECIKDKTINKINNLIYCTNNTLFLLDYYDNKGIKDKYKLLMERIEHDIPIVDKIYLDYSDVLHFCEIKKAHFSNYRKSIGYNSPFDSYFEDMINKHLSLLEYNTKALSRKSNFTEIAFHIELLLEYSWQSRQFDKGIEICNNLIELLEMKNICPDLVVKQSVEEQLEIIKTCQLFFEFLQDGKDREVNMSVRLGRYLSRMVNENKLYNVLDRFVRNKKKNVEWYLPKENEIKKLEKYS